MEKYVQDIRLQQWCGIIEAANKSKVSRKQWLDENGITRDAFYYWQRKVRKYYAQKNGLIPADASDSEKCCMVELPVAYATGNNKDSAPAAIIRIGNMSIEISPKATAEFMENLGRMIHNAL